MSNLYAKDKNIFFDAKIDLPFGGEGVYSDGIGSTKDIYETPRAFLGVALGYSFKLTNRWLLEPSIGYNFSSGDSMSLIGGDYLYNYLDMTLPIMYKKKGIKGGVYLKYIDIPSITWGNHEYGDYIEFVNNNAYALGMKVVTRSWFFSYEYLFKGKYSVDYEQAKINIEGSRISIGIRSEF
jgi:hypothetical protein